MAMKKVIYDFYSDLFDSYVYLPTYHVRQSGYVFFSALPSEIRRGGIKPEDIKSLPFIVKTLARLFTRFLSECQVPTSWRTSKIVLLYNKGDPDNIGNYRQSACCL
uniref:Piwi domain-containing protein n=1 Tax=Haemonchus contortus TaxID=6289 RepID=A0A7I4YD29_HAECO